jgi:hypothetical protein
MIAAPGWPRRPWGFAGAGLSRELHKPGLNFDNHRNIGMRASHPAQELQT